MGALGYIVGGAMQGIGAAWAQQTRDDASRRHEMALENLRQQNQRENMGMQADYQDRNAQRSDERGDFYDARRTERTTSATTVLDRNRSQLNREEADQQFGHRVALTRIENANEREMAAIRSRLGREDAAYAQALEAGDVTETLTGADGYYYFRRRNGETVRSTVQAPPEAGTGILGATSPAAPAPAPRPAATPRAAPATGPVNERYSVPSFGGAGNRAPAAAAAPRAGAVVDGYRFKGGDPSNQQNWERVR